jgi:hypothetical protein
VAERRPVALSAEQVLRHYAVTSSRRFMAYEFSLLAYDYASRQRIFRGAMIRCRRSVPRVPGGPIDASAGQSASTWGTRFTALSLPNVALAAAHFEETRRCVLARRQPPPPLDVKDPVSTEFLRSIRLSTANAQHTNAFAADARRRIFAMQNELGPPALWYSGTVRR